MKNTTPLFPNFHLQRLRRTPRSGRQILLDKAAQLQDKSLMELCECVGKFLPQHRLKSELSGAMSRHRIYSKENTFWGSLLKFWVLTVAAKKSSEKFRFMLRLKAKESFLHLRRLILKHGKS